MVEKNNTKRKHATIVEPAAPSDNAERRGMAAGKGHGGWLAVTLDDCH